MQNNHLAAPHRALSRSSELHSRIRRSAYDLARNDGVYEWRRALQYCTAKTAGVLTAMLLEEHTFVDRDETTSSRFRVALRARKLLAPL